MQKLFVVLLLIYTFIFITAETVSAGDFVVSASAILANTRKPEQKNFDMRVIKLQNFLRKYKSPMENYSQYIIQKSDEYGLDWRLIPAIAGVESTFGKNMPRNSFNAYGWANGAYKFKSWENSIDIVAKTLRERYINRGANSVEKIARIYAPPSNTWASNVKFFVYKIEPSPIEFEL